MKQDYFENACIYCKQPAKDKEEELFIRKTGTCYSCDKVEIEHQQIMADTNKENN